MKHELIVAAGGPVVTMSSREIAELVEARHDSVKRAIERLALRDIVQLPPLVEVKNHLGQMVEEYHVGKRDTYVIVAQLSPEFTARLVDRWQQLETQVAAVPQLPTTFVEALRLAADEAEKRLIAEEAQRIAETRLIEVAPMLAVAELVEQQRWTLDRYLRTLDGVNSLYGKRGLLRAGYFYQDPTNAYRVYAKYRDTHFIEKVTAQFGKVDIHIGPKGYEVITQLFHEGKLTMRKGFQ